MFCSRMVWLIVGLLCRREQRSPCRQALREGRKGKREAPVSPRARDPQSTPGGRDGARTRS
jgi:hypothetical protein